LTEFRPALRSDVRIEPGLEGALYDAGLDRKFVLHGEALALARLLDGTRTLADLREQLGGPPGEIDRGVRGFLLLNLTEGAGSDIVDRCRRVLRGELQLPRATLDGARFACQGSGECCQNYNLGPLDDEDVRRIDALDLSSFGEGPFIEAYSRDESGAPEHYLRKVDERCIFLQPDMRCGLHARFGPAAKPNLCRVYPLLQTTTLDGVKISDYGSCSSFATSCRAGRPLAEELVQLRPLLGEPYPLFHPAAFLDDVTACDYGHFLSLTRANLALIDAGIGSAGETLRAVGRQTRHLTTRLGTCPIVPGEPDATVADALSLPPASWYEAPAAVEISEACARVSALAGLLAAAVTDGGTRLHGQLATLLGLVQRVNAHAAAPAETPLIAEDRRVARVQPAHPELDEVLRLSLRQQVFGRGGLMRDQAMPALLRLAMIQLCAVWGARLRAALLRLPSLRVEDLSWGHTLAVRILGLQASTEVLVNQRPDAVPIVEALPSLLSLRV
jgi:Fe-S-cluster containining protein